MTIRWTASARADLERIYDFAASYDPELAVTIARQLANAPKLLRPFKRRGSLLREYAPREVREFRIAHYLLRYELVGDDVIVLRLFHAREDRF